MGHWAECDQHHITVHCKKDPFSFPLKPTLRICIAELFPFKAISLKLAGDEFKMDSLAHLSQGGYLDG